MRQHSRTQISRRDISAVRRVLKSGIVADSSNTRLLEEEVRRMHGALRAKAVCSGTRALIVALESLEVGPGGYVFTTSYVCEDIKFAIRARGATPVFCDIDISDFNIDVNDLRKRISQLSPNLRDYAAVIVPHIFGSPANLSEILSLGLPVIEDVTHALGGKSTSHQLGSLGHAAICSMQALKVITSGEGGLVWWNQEPRSETANAGDHLSDINSALARSQLMRLSDILDHKRRLSDVYKNSISDLFGSELRMQKEVHGSSTRYRFVVLVPANVDIERLQKRLRARGIIAQRPVKMLLWNDNNGLSPAQLTDLPVARSVFERALSLPAHLHISARDAKKISNVLFDEISLFG